MEPGLHPGVLVSTFTAMQVLRVPENLYTGGVLDGSIDEQFELPCHEHSCVPAI
jgi:hypothetical protein